jgi:hypothetical protein
MAILHDAILALNPEIVKVINWDGTEDIAYDKNDKVIKYDLSAAKEKLVELKDLELQKKQQEEESKAQTLAKLAALGLTQEEIQALLK